MEIKELRKELNIQIGEVVQASQYMEMFQVPWSQNSNQIQNVLVRHVLSISDLEIISSDQFQTMK